MVDSQTRGASIIKRWSASGPSEFYRRPHKPTNLMYSQRQMLLGVIISFIESVPFLEVALLSHDNQFQYGMEGFLVQIDGKKNFFRNSY